MNRFCITRAGRGSFCVLRFSISLGPEAVRVTLFYELCVRCFVYHWKHSMLDLPSLGIVLRQVSAGGRCGGRSGSVLLSYSRS